MDVLEASEIYNLISRGSRDVETRKQTRLLRKVALDSISSGNGFTKVAFDTRRIDQETQFNPRRGLQNYNRSEAFLSEGTAQRVKNFSKLRKILNGLKEVYGKEHEWQDSNARVLLAAIDNGLRTGIFNYASETGLGLNLGIYCTSLTDSGQPSGTSYWTGMSGAKATMETNHTTISTNFTASPNTNASFKGQAIEQYSSYSQMT